MAAAGPDGSTAAGGRSFALARAMRDVLLGDGPAGALTGARATRARELRASELRHRPPRRPGDHRAGGDVRWWTWAGYRANATLAATLSELVDGAARFDDVSIRLRERPDPGSGARNGRRRRPDVSAGGRGGRSRAEVQ